MRIGLAYNQKPEPASTEDPESSNDAYAEWDDPATIAAVEQALGPFGSVIRLEADQYLPQKLALSRPDLVFNMAEGFRGQSREALVPAICEYLSIPYTGSDPLTLALSLHKSRTKETLAFRGVPTAPFACLETPDDLDRMALPFPVFVKPVAEGSGKGVFSNNLCDGPVALRERVRFLVERYAEPVLVETYLPGPEFTVAILGNGQEAYCLPVIGFDFSALPQGAPPVYGYEAKWVWDRPEAPLAIFQCPARVPAGLYREIERTALDAYHALGCRDWCRVDVRVDRFGVPNILELNPLPGIIPDPAMNSCFPKAARAAGFGYDELIQEVVRLAWRRLTGRDVLTDVRARAVVGAQPAAPLPATASRRAKPLDIARLARAGPRAPRWTGAEGKIEDDFPLPAIVKPAAEDASAGLDRGSVVGDRRALRARVAAMTEQFDEVLVQEYVAGREFNVGFVGSRALPISQIDFSRMPEGAWPILTYAGKWEAGSPDDLGSVPVCPATVPQKLADRLVRVAEAAWRVMQGKGYGRVDLRLDHQGRVWVLEVNPNPDLNDDAGLSRMAKAAGWEYPELVRRIAEVGLRDAQGAKAARELLAPSRRPRPTRTA